MNNNTSNSVKEIPILKFCTACGTCAGICPNHAIKMKLSKHTGTFEPCVDSSKCNNCGLCKKCCSGFENNLSQMNTERFGKATEDNLIGTYQSIHVCQAVDDNIRRHAASGGAISALLIYALTNKLITGAIVTHMSAIEPFLAEPFIARTPEEIIQAAQSKYCPVPLNSILSLVLAAPQSETFALVGLPCHLHSLHKATKYIKKLKTIKYTLGLLCAHTDSYCGTEFLLSQLKLKPKDAIDITYRGDGWPGAFTVKSKTTGITKRIPYRKYMPLFHSYNIFTPQRCLLCNDATAELADISFGDAWDVPVPGALSNGQSVVISRSNDGTMLLREAERSNAIKLFNTTYYHLVNSQRGSIYNKKIALPWRIAALKLLRIPLPSICPIATGRSFYPWDAIFPFVNSKTPKIFFKYRFLVPPIKFIFQFYGPVTNLMARKWVKRMFIPQWKSQ